MVNNTLVYYHLWQTVYKFPDEQLGRCLKTKFEARPRRQTHPQPLDDDIKSD